MKSFQNFAISFTIISILAGCLTSYYIAFQWGGPVAVSWGWLIVGGFCIIVSLAMAEIASTYPTAGGLYYWASKLGHAGHGWFTGWFNLVGQIAVTAAIGYGLAIFATSLLNLLWSYPNNSHWIFVTYSVVMLIALGVTFAIPETQGVIDAGGNAVTYIWQTSMSTRWAELLLFIAVVAQLFCLTASTTSASRMMFAFSRDGAVPGWRVWRKVARNRVPWAAVHAIGVLSWLLMVPTLWNAVVGYLVGTSVAVIGLYIAFAIPIWLRWRKGESFERRAWHLGSHYKWMDPVALAWITLICILFILPIAPAGIPFKAGFDWNVANYAPVTGGGARKRKVGRGGGRRRPGSAKSFLEHAQRIANGVLQKEKLAICEKCRREMP